jgi:glycosyltransferase involved in cell wall biosynthesis
LGAKVVVGVPAFNEEATIASVVKTCRPFASTILVVDDGSTDETATRAYESGATVLRHESNGGKGVAVATIFDFANRELADILVLLDGDGQHDPGEIPNLLEKIASGDSDIVVGSRFVDGAGNATPGIRKIGQRFFNTMTYLLSGVRCSDSQSGFRAFNRRAITSMRFSADSFSVESEMQFECRARALTLAEVPITCSYDSPPKRNIVRHGLIVLTGLIRLAATQGSNRRGPYRRLPASPTRGPVADVKSLGHSPAGAPGD